MVVVYKSNNGYSKAYAELLADALDLNVYSIANSPMYLGNNAIFFGWLAGTVVELKRPLKI